MKKNRFPVDWRFCITIFSVTGSEFASDLATGSISAPFVEESLKGMAVLLVFWFFHREFDSVLDGIVYAGIAALGFAATENVLYIWRGYDASGWDGLFQLVLIRVILVGWQHPFYTAFTGIGLATARMNRSWLVKFIAPVSGLSLAMFTHSFHNTLAGIPFFGDLTCVVGSFLDWVWRAVHVYGYSVGHVGGAAQPDQSPARGNSNRFDLARPISDGLLSLGTVFRPNHKPAGQALCCHQSLLPGLRGTGT
jgi:PrsW family intramembrane metalloprotease